ncbi:Rad9-domain-containing protein [Aureobasidium subglaciale]|nr:Rad9-domain-containing protein [Aureobasidium subglaciale]
MPTLSFAFSPEATTKVHDALICLAKFGETVCMEARGDMLTLTTLNSSRTSYASFSLDAKSFFLSYNFGLGQGARFTCQLYNKALLAVFKTRMSDPRGGDTSIDRCEVSVEDKPSKVQCRLVVRMVCKHEQLDLLVKEGKAIFTSFTEKIMDGKAISLHIQDFDDFHAEEDVHIVINVKDFKAIVTHAETLKAPMCAQFSRPGRPLLFRYTEKGLTCEFILMTTGIAQSAPPTTAPRVASTRPSGQPSRQASRQASTVSLRPSRQSTVDADASTGQQSTAPDMSSRQSSHAPVQTVENRNTEMAPPPRPVVVNGLRDRRALGSLGRQTSQATTSPHDADSTSLFVSQNDEDDGRWEPPNLDEEPDEMLGWDTTADLPKSQQKHARLATYTKAFSAGTDVLDIALCLELIPSTFDVALLVCRSRQHEHVLTTSSHSSH